MDYNAYKGTVQDLAAFLAEPVPTAPAPTGPRNLVQGDSGPDVAAVQKQLQEHGYSLAYDGNFGPITDTRVRQYQHDHGLGIDGQVGPQTSGSLAQQPRPCRSPAPTPSSPAPPALPSSHCNRT